MNSTRTIFTTHVGYRYRRTIQVNTLVSCSCDRIHLSTLSIELIRRNILQCVPDLWISNATLISPNNDTPILGNNHSNGIREPVRIFVGEAVEQQVIHAPA